MNIASVIMGLVADPAAEAYLLQAFINSSKAVLSSLRSAFRNPSHFLISLSKTIR